MSLILSKSISITAPAAKVWEVLTKPEYTKQYMYNCEIVSDWNVGDSFNWKGTYEGVEGVFVTGTLKALEPEKYLEYTTADPNRPADSPTIDSLTVTYTLKADNGNIILTVTQGDYDKPGHGEQKHADTAIGWGKLLIMIRDLAETV